MLLLLLLLLTKMLYEYDVIFWISIPTYLHMPVLYAKSTPRKIYSGVKLAYATFPRSKTGLRDFPPE